MLVNNHHAFLYIGTWNREALVRELLSQLGVSFENNPDIIIHEGPLGIDEARMVSARVATRPFGEKRVLIIDASEATVQAQNALLKTLEEPGEGNHFFLVAPYEDILLPTLRSRLQRWEGEPLVVGVPLGEKAGKDSADHFLKLTPTKRLEFAKKFKDDERQLGPFLDSLLVLLKARNVSSEILKKVFIVRRYADDTSSDSRLILEHLALVL